MRALSRLLRVVALGAALVGGAVLVRRLFFRRRERVDLYYEDGAMASFEEGSPEAERLLGLAHEALRAAGTSAGAG